MNSLGQISDGCSGIKTLQNVISGFFSSYNRHISDQIQSLLHNHCLFFHGSKKVIFPEILESFWESSSGKKFT